MSEANELFGVEEQLQIEKKHFGALKVSEDVLGAAMAAANKVLAENGATAGVASIVVRQLKDGNTTDSCRCLRYERVCSTIMVWDPVTKTYAPYTQCETRCAQWECDA